MVTMSSLEKITHVSKLTDCVPISQSSAAGDNKLDISREDERLVVNKFLSRSVSQNNKMQPDVYLDSTFCKADRQLVGSIGVQNESSLFSSSLSDLWSHKLKLSSNNFSSRQLAAITTQKSEADAFESQDEKGQANNNLLPDEEELFSGIVDEFGLSSHANAPEDLEDFDLFTCSGGIELEADNPSQASQRNVGYDYSWDPNQNQHSTPTSIYPNSVVFSDALPHEDSLRKAMSLAHRAPHPSPQDSHIYNGFQSPVRISSIGSEFGINEASRSLPHVQLENREIPSFHPHSHHMRLPNVGNILPSNSLDGVRGIANDIRPTITENDNFNHPHLGLNGHALELGDGAFAFSPNAINVHQSVSSKTNSHQRHHPRSLLMPNSPSFMNNNHAPNLGRLPGSPGAPHFMMNMASPVHQLQIGSAPVVKASIWDKQQMYSGVPHDASGYQMGGISGVDIPGFSPSHAQDISSRGSFPRVNGACAEMARNGMNISYGSPSERVRGRRNETNLNHADRKHYELNIGRILRGEDSRTTLMIKNIPNKYTSKMLLATIDEQHRGKYDFIYLPIDFKNKCNMGYAFINMVDPLQIVPFHQTFEGRKWEKFNSEKVATLAYARIQGKAALIAHFQNSSLMNEDKRCRPILFHTNGPNAGDQEPFPISTNFRPKPGRFQEIGTEYTK